MLTVISLTSKLMYLGYIHFNYKLLQCFKFSRYCKNTHSKKGIFLFAFKLIDYLEDLFQNKFCRVKANFEQHVCILGLQWSSFVWFTVQNELFHF